MKNWLALFLLFTPVVGFADNVASKPANLQETCIQELGGNIQVNCQTQFNLVNITSGTVPSFAVVGSTTNNDAPLGRIGQYVESTGQSTVNFPASGVLGDISSISLPAGDWDVSFLVYWGKNGATVTSYELCIGPNIGNDNTGLQNGINCVTAATAVSFNNTVEVETLPTYRVSLNSTTTRYLKLSAIYTVATPQYFGFRMSARRPR